MLVYSHCYGEAAMVSGKPMCAEPFCAEQFDEAAEDAKNNQDQIAPSPLQHYPSRRGSRHGRTFLRFKMG